MFQRLNKDKVLAGVNACIQPSIANCQECPYWNNGDKQCEELRLDIAEFAHTAINLYNTHKDSSDLQECSKSTCFSGEIMKKICRNCKHFASAGGGAFWCTHKNHSGTLVPPFTTCKQFEAKKSRTPFDNIKLISKDNGEVVIHYICEECGKEMKEPASWQINLPLDKSPNRPVYRYYCEDCTK